MSHTTPEERADLAKWVAWIDKTDGDQADLVRRLLLDLEDAEAAAKHHSLDRAAAEFQRDLALAERDRLRAEVERLRQESMDQ